MKKKWNKYDLCFLVLAVVILIIQFWKAHIGMGFDDEWFYTTLGHRLTTGDGLFYDDWHIAQMISVFIAPFVKLYVSIHHSTEEIILYIRMVYAVIQTLMGTLLYFRFREYKAFAIAGSVLFLLMTPFNIMALSYNTMSIWFLLGALLILSLHISSKRRVYQWFAAGLLYACAVLNTPYLAVLFLIYTILVILWHKTKESFGLKRYWSAFAGCGTAAIIFIAFVLSRSSVSEVLAGLPHFIDPSHSTNMLYLFLTDGYKILQIYGVWIVLLAGLLVVVLVDKGRLKRRTVYFNLSIVITAVAIITYLLWNQYQLEIGGFNTILIPIVFHGLITYCLTENKNKEVFVLFYCVSVLHALCIALSSNVGPRAFSNPLITAAFITILFQREYLEENPYRTVKVGICVLCTISILTLAFFKMTNIYGGEDISTQTVTIEAGPLKGLKTSSSRAQDYKTVLSDVRSINALAGENITYITANTWMYLTTDKEYATNSSYIYFYEKEELFDCLDQYFEMHLDKLPTYVYVDDSNKLKIDGSEEWFSDLKKIEDLNHGKLYLKTK